MNYYTMPDGEKLYVRELGRGKPVLILSGLGMSSWQWLAFITPSLSQCRFIIPDYRGFGGSKNCKIPTQLDAIASHWQDIDCLVKQLAEKGMRDLDVVAYSMGATTAMHGFKYGNFTQFVRRYLQIDQTAKFKNDAQWQWGFMGKQQDATLTTLAKITTLLAPYTDKKATIHQLPKNTKRQLAKTTLDLIQQQNPQSHLYRMLAQLNPTKIALHALPLQSIPYLLWYLNSYLEHDEDYRAALTALQIPTRFIIGKKSALYQAQGQLYLAEQLEQVKIHTFKHSGHAPLLNEPFKFTQVLNHFLQSTH